MKNVLVIVIIGTVVYAGYNLLNPDTYVGFFYPDADNLSVDIMSDETFESVSECRMWAEGMAMEYAEEILSHDNGYDYECGLNCDVTGSKPYSCEETMR